MNMRHNLSACSQACTEMVFPMCSDGVNDMFEAKEWNLTEYKINCKNTWKVTPRENFETLMYGAKKLHAASNIVFRYPLTVSNKSPG